MVEKYTTEWPHKIKSWETYDVPLLSLQPLGIQQVKVDIILFCMYKQKQNPYNRSELQVLHSIF